jgi:hypothetical protein
LRFGPTFAFFGTTASMIAVVNNLVAGAGVALLVGAMASPLPTWVCASIGVAVAAALTWAFHRYQRWRFTDVEPAQGW